MLNCLLSFHLGSELMLIDVRRLPPCHLDILCDPEDSIVVTTTFLRTWLTCIDCCLQPKRGLLATRTEDMISSKMMNVLHLLSQADAAGASYEHNLN